MRITKGVFVIFFILASLLTKQVEVSTVATADLNKLKDAIEVSPKIIRIRPVIPSEASVAWKQVVLTNAVNENNTSVIVIKSLKRPNNPSIRRQMQQNQYPGNRFTNVPSTGKSCRKRLKFIHREVAENGMPITRVSTVHIAPGAYPIFYGLSKINGKFAQNPIRIFKGDEIEKMFNVF